MGFRLICISSVSSLALSTSVFAAPSANFEDELFLPETPLTTEELQEARGGFTIAGLNFVINVDIPVVTVEPVVIGAPFGEGGPLAGSDITSEGGLFGADGPLGAGGVAVNVGGNGADAETTPAADVAPSSQEAASSQSAPSSSVVSSHGGGTNNAPNDNSAAPVNSAASDAATAAGPTQEPAPVAQTAQTPSSASQPAPEAAPVENSPVANTTANNDATAPDNTKEQTQQNNPAPNGPETGQDIASVSQPDGVEEAEAAVSFSMNETDPEPQPQTMSLTELLSTVINNDLSNVIIRRQININVSVANYGTFSDMHAARAMTSRIVSSNLFLGALN